MPEKAPDAAGVGELVQSREALLADDVDLDLSGETGSLDWQPELDSALEAIDSVLPVKRRRATDPPGTAFPRPGVSVLTFTPEVLDALATRVAEKNQGLAGAAQAAGARRTGVGAWQGALDPLPLAALLVWFAAPPV